MQPVVHVSAMYEAIQREDPAEHLPEVETGGEDLPEAYRWIPADPAEAHINM